jgi:flap endonuclease-1
MARVGDVDYAGTEDYDALLFGTPLTLRQLTSSGDPELMDFEATLEDHGLSWEQLVDVAILMGTDFNEGIAGVGPKTAVKLVDEHGDLWGALEATDAHIDHADRIRNLFLDPTVDEDYAFDTTVDPDVEAARQYVIETWEVDEDEVNRGFTRIEDALVQTGLDRWS